MADALNCHPEIVIQGEIQHDAMKLAVDFLYRSDAYFDGQCRDEASAKWADTWLAHRKQVLFSLWTSMQKYPAMPMKRSVKWFGNKTPFHDQFWRFYEDFFSGDGPRYIFCMRNFTGHYLSMNSLRSAHTIERVSKNYRLLIDRYSEMKQEIGERVSLFVLDDLKTGGIDYLKSVTFDAHGIEVDNSTLRMIDTAKPANSTEQRGKARRRELTGEEQSFLDKNPDLLDALDRMRDSGKVAA